MAIPKDIRVIYSKTFYYHFMHETIIAADVVTKFMMSDHNFLTFKVLAFCLFNFFRKKYEKDTHVIFHITGKIIIMLEG